MGCFSWLDCKTQEAVKIGKRRSVYVLIPKNFGGGHIKESIYRGYGDFGGCDVYDLVAEWNKESLDLDNLNTTALATPNEDDFGGLWAWEMLDLIKKGLTQDEVNKRDKEARHNNFLREAKRVEAQRQMVRDFCGGLSDDEMIDKYGEDYKREIGINLACYDEDNASLPYPIKITYDETAVYEDCEISLSDPNQGC